ncbi:MAG: nickel transporter, partial [Candidatus Velamenicoccus archaeovorus]
MRLGIRAPVMLGVVGLVLLLPGTASAHPLGNFTINVYAGIELRPGGVTIDYVVDMAEIPTFQELPAIDADGDGRAATAELAAWARLQASR